MSLNLFITMDEIDFFVLNGHDYTGSVMATVIVAIIALALFRSWIVDKIKMIRRK